MKERAFDVLADRQEHALRGRALTAVVARRSGDRPGPAPEPDGGTAVARPSARRAAHFAQAVAALQRATDLPCLVFSRPVTPELLQAVVDLTVDFLGVATILAPSGVRVHCEVVTRRREHEAQADFLNSFFIEDLRRVADAAAADDCGSALIDYLSSDETVAGLPRWDVRDPAHTGRLLDELAPERVPAGRWPANPKHSLATSQQLAINAMLYRLTSNPGVFAVNGPPGTGKTTMLRDLIAALVVERGRRLARLRTPAAGFTGETVGWKTDKHQRRIRPLRPELTGFEMVVASANNGALANVTREIPQSKAIDECWADEASYLPEHAERVLGEPAWGMVAAMLGNKRNRREFVGRLWYGDPADPDKKPGDEGPGLLDWLKNAEADNTLPWMEAVKAFTDALAAEQVLRDARRRAHTALRALPDLRRASEAAIHRHAQALAGQRQAEAAVHVATAAVRAARQAVDEAQRRRHEHYRVKPGFWENVFTFGKAIRRWHAEDTTLHNAITDADRAAAAAVIAADTASQAAKTAADDVIRTAAGRDRTAENLDDAQRILDQAQRDFPGAVPDDT